MLTILDPAGVPRTAADHPSPFAPSLDGCTVGILSNHWQSMDRMAQRMSERLRERYRVSAVKFYDVPLNGAMAEATRAKVLAECNAAVVGLAN